MSSICVWFYGLQSLFIVYMKTVLEVLSSKARIGYNPEGICYRVIQKVIQKQRLHLTVVDWLMFNNYLFKKIRTDYHIYQFLGCKCSHCEQFQATNVTSVKAKMERDAHTWLSKATTRQPQHATGQYTTVPQ